MKIAVVIPNYNGAQFLREAIESVMAQTRMPEYVLVCDDGSQDASRKILTELSEQYPEMMVLYHDRNRGISATRNTLLTHIPKDVGYIAILDSDDVMEKERLERQSRFLDEHHEIGIVGSWVHVINADGVIIQQRLYPLQPDAVRNALLQANPIAQSAVMMRTSVVDRVGLYDESLRYIEDLDYWARAVRQGVVCANIPMTLTRFRVHRAGGRFARNRSYLWHNIRVRARYARGRMSVWVRIGLYGVALCVPQRVRLLLSKQFFGGYE